MKYIGQLIEEKCVEGRRSPHKAFRGNVGISHLIFADDLILFGEANDDACEAISEVLQTFCSESGQKVGFVWNTMILSDATQFSSLSF